MKTTALLTMALLGGLLPGAQAPDFSAKNQDGKTVKLSDFKGKRVLLYFYPKDDTPGCTTEAKNFTLDYEKFQKAGVVILGISRQGEESHKAFRQKYGIPFDLLIDDDGSVAKAFGVGTIPILGVHHRQSVLIDKDGKVLQFFEDVDPKVHSAEVMAAVQAADAKH
jgi:peroxiredoxin Q/BCP